MKNPQTAILVFSRSAIAESKHKRLAHTQSQTQDLAAQMIKHTKSTVSATDLPFFIISEEQQRGQSFGEKMANAFQDVFAQGFYNVIAVGNDCISLSALDIIYAADVLQKSKAVIGPTLDGGAYLIGLTQKSFDYEAFKNLAWQSSATFEHLFEYFNLFLTIPTVLDYKADVDCISDWNLALQSVSLQFKTRILTILKNTESVPSKFDLIYNNSYLELPSSLRAPPVFQ